MNGKSHMRTLVGLGLAVAVLLLVSLAAAASQPAKSGMHPAHHQAGMLDGKVFMGELNPMGQQKGCEERLSFKADELRPAECTLVPQQAIAYTATKSGDTIHFDAVSESTHDGTLTWRGTVHADRAEATVRWQKKDGSVAEYRYEGTARG